MKKIYARPLAADRKVNHRKKTESDQESEQRQQSIVIESGYDITVERRVKTSCKAAPGASKSR